MTAPRRILPAQQIRDTLDLLKEYGIDVSRCAIDIGPDRVKVSPPANSNAPDSLASYIDRPAHRQQAAEKR